MSARNWADNSIQFPRLIAEAEAAGAFTAPVLEQMQVSMDLRAGELLELIDRAQAAWDDIKSQLPRRRK